MSDFKQRHFGGEEIIFAVVGLLRSCLPPLQVLDASVLFAEITPNDAAGRTCTNNASSCISVFLFCIVGGALSTSRSLRTGLFWEQ